MSTILALDIGTEFVKAVIAKSNRKGELDVIGVGRAKQAPTNIFAGAIADIPAVISVCEKALLDAEEEAGETAKMTVVGIAGELIKGSTTTVRYHRENPNKPITDHEMSIIIDKVQERAGEAARKTVALETGNKNVEVRLINSAIVSLTIDGYKISNPIGFKGSDIVIQFYTAFAPLIHVSAIEKVCAELDLELLTVAVEPFAVCRACLGDDLESTFSGIVIDIGGGTTDIAVVDDGGVDGTRMFSIGGRSFTKQIADSLGVDFDTAEGYKLDLENLDTKIKTKVEKTIEQNLNVWISGVEVALEDFNIIEVLPRNVLLCGGGASLMPLQEMLALSDWYKNLPFSRRPTINIIDVATLPGITYRTKTPLDHSYATALGLLRVGVDTLASAPDENNLRTKIAKLLQN